MGRVPCCEKVGLKRGRWTAEEDEILRNYIQANGVGSWRSLPKNAGLLRCGKSCRLRWINYLRSDLKRGNISAEEEEIIIKLHATFGNRWSLIAGHLSGRTDNEIKNYWSSHLSRKIHSLSSHLNRKNHSFRRRPRNKALPVPSPPPPPLSMDIAKSGVAASKPRGSPTSRAATKKNKLSYIPPTKAPKLLQKLQDSEAGMVGSGEEREGLVLCHGEEERESRSSVLSSGGDRENEELFCLHLLEIMGDELVDLESGGKGYYCRSSTNSYMEEVNWKWDAVVEGHEIWGWGKREDGDLGV